MTDTAAAKAILTDVVSNPFAYGLPEVITVDRVSGGFAHDVYKLNTLRARFYLKIRGNCFPRMPQIAINARDILYEYRALTMLGAPLPGYFPEVVYFDPERCFLVLTDAMVGEAAEACTLEHLLLERRVQSTILHKMGTILREIHDSAGGLSEAIRPDDDRAFFDLKLQHRFGYQNVPALNAAIRDLTEKQPRQIILGDPSPKNIGGESLMFFDLEDVHRGCVVFDAGFVMGHLILHAHDDTRRAVAYVQSFLQGYNNGCLLDTWLAKVIALGTLMYRLTSIIPYPVDLSDAAKEGLVKRATRMLENVDLGQSRWSSLITVLLAEQVS